MSVNSEIRDGLIAIWKQAHVDTSAFSAEVTAVDIPNRSCTVMSISDTTETEYPNVWLMPEVNDGILYVPTIGSTVIVENNKNLQPYIVMWSQIDQVLYVVNQTTFSVTDGLTQFNKGENDGLVNIKPLVQKINALENLLNDLITKYNSHTHILTLTSGTGTAAPTVTLEGGTISPITEQSDIEDTAVKH